MSVRRNVYAYTSIQTHIYLHLYSQRLQYPREALQFFAYIPGAFWTKQHLTVTLTFKNH